MTPERWTELTEWPVMLAAFTYLAVYSWEVPSPRTIPSGVAHTTLQGIWLLFVAHYVVSLALAPERRSWFLRDLHELVIVTLRLLRLLTALDVLHRVVGTALRGRVIVYVIGGSCLLVYIAALTMYDAERNRPGSITTNFGDALWWAVVSVTTVGYGDPYPVTLTGRLVTVALMLYGIALLGVVTATLASWLIQQVAEEEKSTVVTVAHIERLSRELLELRGLLAEPPQQPGSSRPPE